MTGMKVTKIELWIIGLRSDGKGSSVEKNTEKCHEHHTGLRLVRKSLRARNKKLIGIRTKSDVLSFHVIMCHLRYGEEKPFRERQTHKIPRV
jgi:hypothetical protein